MEASFSGLLSVASLVFAVSSMLVVGFRYTLQEIIAPLRNRRLVIGALVANFLLVPVLAYAITRLLPFGAGREVGLILVATAAGAPFVIVLAQIARADIPIAAGLLVILLVVTIVYMPLVVPLIVPAGSTVSTASIARPLVLTMLLPLVIGLVANWAVPAWTKRLLPILGLVSNTALVVLLLSALIANFGRMVDVVGTGALLATILFIVGAFVIGYILGMTGQGTREELALATAQRNIAAATVVATQTIGDPDTITMVVIVSVLGLIILFIGARGLSRQREGPPPWISGTRVDRD